jgi:hypothetical protein
MTCSKPIGGMHGGEGAACCESGPVDAAYVLVHSLLLGPLSWAPVAAGLAGSGVPTAVPSLVGVTDVAEPPFWPQVTDAVNEAMTRLPADRPVVVVAHSNAGLLVPSIVQTVRRPVAGCLFVDARLPDRTGPSPAATPERLAHLQALVAADGRLPPWTTWWDEEDVARLFPDRETRAAISAEQPRLPLSYYEQRIPVPAGWDDRPCGYLLFGPPYDLMAKDARERGWAVDQLPGGHLHQLVDPGAVASRLVAMTEKWF